MDLPIVCMLAKEQLQERRNTILAVLRESTIRVEPLTDGYVYMFNAESEQLKLLAELVDLERQCCQFLAFRIVLEPQSPIRLEITGPAAAKSVIADFFGS